jgi:4-amino-4-deoxy-L-arabinose transferase-like glycosyltransferase
VCALVAVLNAACWSILTPPFQVPDEPNHFAYVKQLALTGHLPKPGVGPEFSNEEVRVIDALHAYEIREQQENRTITTRSQQNALQRALQEGEPSSERAPVSTGVAASQPPLYYALEAVPYSLGGNLLDRLELMRLFSALLGGLTALFVFLFVREALPGAPWAWTVGGLSIALFPLLGFMSGAVNPDAMLFAVSAAMFYCLARAFQRGLTAGMAVALGALTLIGLATKLNFIGLVPGVFLGILILGVRAGRSHGRAGYRSLGIALAVAGSPVAVYAAIRLASHRSAFGIVSSGVALTHGSLLKELAYIWQLYLPRVPGMSNYFHGVFTARQIWFDGFVGLYGWLDTPFPAWVETLALIPAALIAILSIRAIVSSRAALRARLAELAVYVVMGVGLLGLIGADSYLVFPTLNAEFGQVRYLLPLLPLLGAVLVLAARGAGRRWGPVAGALVVVLFLAHDIFSQLQVLARFYG